MVSERKIERMFGLKEVIIVPSSPIEIGTQHISSAIGRGTLEYLSGIGGWRFCRRRDHGNDYTKCHKSGWIH